MKNKIAAAKITLHCLCKPAISAYTINFAEAGVHDYVRYCNHERITLGLQRLSPVEYRLRGTA